MRLREGTRASMQDQTWSRTGTPLSSNSCVLILLGVQWGGSGACNRKCACREKKFWKIILPFFSNQEGSHRPHLARKWAPGSGTRGPWNFSSLARSYIAFASSEATHRLMCPSPRFPPLASEKEKSTNLPLRNGVNQRSRTPVDVHARPFLR